MKRVFHWLNRPVFGCGSSSYWLCAHLWQWILEIPRDNRAINRHAVLVNALNCVTDLNKHDNRNSTYGLIGWGLKSHNLSLFLSFFSSLLLVVFFSSHRLLSMALLIPFENNCGVRLTPAERRIQETYRSSVFVWLNCAAYWIDVVIVIIIFRISNRWHEWITHSEMLFDSSRVKVAHTVLRSLVPLAMHDNQ